MEISENLEKLQKLSDTEWNSILKNFKDCVDRIYECTFCCCTVYDWDFISHVNDHMEEFLKKKSVYVW